LVEHSGDVSVYLDLRTIGSAEGLYTDSNLSAAVRGTHLLVDTLEAIHEQLLSVAFEREVSDQNGLLVALDALAEAATAMEVVGEVERETKFGGSAETSIGVELMASPNAKLSATRRRSATAESRLRHTGIERAGGRPSKSFDVDQAVALLNAAVASRLYAYIVVSLLTGVRTEEARALTWDRVHLQPVNGLPAHVEVWRSVRGGGDTKTKKSRRTLELPPEVVEALLAHQALQQADRLKAAPLWTETGLVFTTTVGTKLDAGNVRRQFRAVVVAAGIEGHWTPRELRHSFVSLLSADGVRIESIAKLVGHASTTVTETVYRHELRPVLTAGAEAISRVLERARSAGAAS
jgi:integrase